LLSRLQNYKKDAKAGKPGKLKYKDEEAFIYYIRLGFYKATTLTMTDDTKKWDRIKY
jgi:hypothetical protein